MTTDQRDLIIKLLRDYVRTCADYRALVAILDSERKTHRVSEDWQSDLHDIQQTKEYRRILKGLDPLICSIESAMADNHFHGPAPRKPLKIVEA